MPDRSTREEVDDLIVRTREAHEVLKDIKAATKELHDTIKQAEQVETKLMSAVVNAVGSWVEQAVESQMENLTKSFDEAVTLATDAVYQRFDVIAGILLGEAGTDEDDMADAALLVRKSMDKNIRLSSVEEWQMEEIQKAVERRLGAPNLRGEKG